MSRKRQTFPAFCCLDQNAFELILYLCMSLWFGVRLHSVKTENIKDSICIYNNNNNNNNNKGFHFCRSRNEPSNLSRSSYFKHGQKILEPTFNVEILSGREVDDAQNYKFGNNLKVTAAEPEDMGGCGFQYANVSSRIHDCIMSLSLSLSLSLHFLVPHFPPLLMCICNMHGFNFVLFYLFQVLQAVSL